MAFIKRETFSPCFVGNSVYLSSLVVGLVLGQSNTHLYTQNVYSINRGYPQPSPQLLLLNWLLSYET